MCRGCIVILVQTRMSLHQCGGDINSKEEVHGNTQRARTAEEVWVRTDRTGKWRISLDWRSPLDLRYLMRYSALGGLSCYRRIAYSTNRFNGETRLTSMHTYVQNDITQPKISGSRKGERSSQGWWRYSQITKVLWSFEDGQSTTVAEYVHIRQRFWP